VDTEKGASALGTQNHSLGINSFATGYMNEAIGDYSIAMPYLANATGHRSLALGFNANASGAGSIALGAHSSTGQDAILSIAIGSLVSTDADNAIVIGFGLEDNPLNNDIESSLMVGFNCDIPSLFIGPSTETGVPGKVGIGTTQPSQLLEVNGNMKVNAYSLLNHLTVENAIVNNSLSLNSNDITGINSLKGNGELKLQSITGGVADITINSDGNVGIGTDTPTFLLDVAGDIRFTGQLYDADGLFEPSPWLKDGSNIYYNDGNVGIGTSTPLCKLDVDGNIRGNSIRTDEVRTLSAGAGLKLFNIAGDGIYIHNDGHVGIGTSDPGDYVLAVAGKILAEELKIEEEVGADFVFYDDYNLPKLEDVEKFIEKNNHLPEIPSANEMKTNGVEIGDLQIKLLQKVEELTLYLIAQQKTINQQHEQIEKQNSEIEKLKGVMQ